MAAEQEPELDTDQMVRHIVIPRLDATNYGLSILSHEVREIRRKQDEHTLLLEEILRRLPPADS